jgi:hypothetical protein
MRGRQCDREADLNRPLWRKVVSAIAMAFVGALTVGSFVTFIVSCIDLFR